MNKYIFLGFAILLSFRTEAASFRKVQEGLWQLDHLDENGKRVSLGDPVCLMKEHLEAPRKIQVDGCYQRTIKETENVSIGEFVCDKEIDGSKRGKVIVEWVTPTEYKVVMDLEKFRSVYFHKYLGPCEKGVTKWNTKAKK